MTVTCTPTGLSEVLVVASPVFRDERGFFTETYHRKDYAAKGIAGFFVQDNHSHSVRGVLRGLHYQLRKPQAKLVFPVTGAIFDVAVDIRKGSRSFGKWAGVLLRAGSGERVWVPEGFAHGFCVLSERADVVYKCTDFYDPGDEHSLLWSDPGLGIRWPVEEPLVSPKDRLAPLLEQIPDANLPTY